MIGTLRYVDALTYDLHVGSCLVPCVSIGSGAVSVFKGSSGGFTRVVNCHPPVPCIDPATAVHARITHDITTLSRVLLLRGPTRSMRRAPDVNPKRRREASVCGAVESEISEIAVPHLGKTVGIHGVSAESHRERETELRLPEDSIRDGF